MDKSVLSEFTSVEMGEKEPFMEMVEEDMAEISEDSQFKFYQGARSHHQSSDPSEADHQLNPSNNSVNRYIKINAIVTK